MNVAVAGGGIAGAAAALALAKAGVSAVVIEASARARWKIGETLGSGARPVLQSLGIWAEYLRAGHLACHGNASAWGGKGLMEKDFIFNPHGTAWQLDRVAFEGLLMVAAEKAGASILRGRKVSELDRAGGRWRIKLDDTTIRADSLIDATGRSSTVARLLGVKRVILDRLVAIYAAAISRTLTDRDTRTFIESCADGWWYSALTPNGQRTVSFQTDADLLPGQQWRTREWFAERLGQTRHLSVMLEAHDYDFPEPPRLTSAHSGRLERFSGKGWLAVGDAAMSFDPLSGQGILKAMRSGITAAEALVAGDQEAFCDFERLNESEWQQFATVRNQYYQLERQWDAEPFWERRKRAASSRE